MVNVYEISLKVSGDMEDYIYIMYVFESSNKICVFAVSKHHFVNVSRWVLMESKSCCSIVTSGLVNECGNGEIGLLLWVTYIHW